MVVLSGRSELTWGHLENYDTTETTIKENAVPPTRKTENSRC